MFANFGDTAINALLTHANFFDVYAGGADGVVLQWDVSDGNLLESRMAGPSITVRSAYGESERGSNVMVRSLDYNEERGVILVGTQQCDIIEITEASQVSLVGSERRKCKCCRCA